MSRPDPWFQPSDDLVRAIEQGLRAEVARRSVFARRSSREIERVKALLDDKAALINMIVDGVEGMVISLAELAEDEGRERVHLSDAGEGGKAMRDAVVAYLNIGQASPDRVKELVL